jgi:hypothetical protein
LIAFTTMARFTTSNTNTSNDVAQNSILFIHDALFFRYFVTSIKCSNICIVMIKLILKGWVLSFRGASRSQYAGEPLRLRHDLAHTWAKPLRDVSLIVTG